MANVSKQYLFSSDVQKPILWISLFKHISLNALIAWLTPLPAVDNICLSDQRGDLFYRKDSD